MKKVALSTTVALALSSSLATASDNNLITAYKIKDDISNISNESRLWHKATPFTITVYPQTTIKMNDKEANEINSDRKAKTVTVQALTDGRNIAFNVKWFDKTKNTQDGTKSDEYPDGMAIQFAQNKKDFKALPYIGMGSPERPVVVYLQKAVEQYWEANGNGDVYHQLNERNQRVFGDKYYNKDLTNYREEVDSLAMKSYQKAFTAEGFRSMTQIRGEHKTDFTMSMKHYEPSLFSDAGWSAVLSKPLLDEYTNLGTESFPLAFAIWDGEKLNRDGLKHISSWAAVQVEGESDGNRTSIDLMSNISGDIANGKEQFNMNCAACHNTAESRMAPNYMAPELTNIGGYSNASYLKESIVAPNAVVVPGYNRNAHKNFEWYNLVDGKRVSTMPAFDWMDEKSLNDIVAYLKTLKAEVE
jgi:complex iron-sulfur molybdoenzyme family reductase subunit gamma